MNVDATGAALDRPSVLVVDDDRTLCTLASEALGAAGFAVETAADGEAALALLETFRPDLILLDVLLPGIDGIALCRQLRAAPETRDTPICIMTGLDDLASIQQAFEAGATDFVIKPPSWAILIQHLRYLLRSCLVARELAAANARLQHEMKEREQAAGRVAKADARPWSKARTIDHRDRYRRPHRIRESPLWSRIPGIPGRRRWGKPRASSRSGEHGPEFYKDVVGDHQGRKRVERRAAQSAQGRIALLGGHDHHAGLRPGRQPGQLHGGQGRRHRAQGARAGRERPAPAGRSLAGLRGGLEQHPEVGGSPGSHSRQHRQDRRLRCRVHGDARGRRGPSGSSTGHAPPAGSRRAAVRRAIA